MTPTALDRTPAGMGIVLRVAVTVAVLAAVTGTVTHGPVSEVAGGIAVGAIVAAPLTRVLLLGVHWARQRDHRFALAALGLLAVAGGGALLALL